MPSIEVREIVPELSERLHVETLRGYPCSDVFPRHLSFFVVHPCFSDDLLHDDLGQFALDVIKLSSRRIWASPDLGDIESIIKRIPSVFQHVV